MSAMLPGGDPAQSAAKTPPPPSAAPEKASITEENGAPEAEIVPEAVPLPDSIPTTPALPAGPETPVGPGIPIETPVVHGKAEETPVVHGEAALDTIAPRADDDVFASTTPQGSAPNTAAPHPVAERVLRNLQAPLITYKGFIPRADRASHVPTAKNAQGIYPPDAAMFVANLSDHRTEDQLEVSCHEAFDGFGPNFVTIKADGRGHPFGVVQFESIEDANNAFSSISNLILDGRKIRLERLKAERAVILSRKDGTPATEQEARGLLEQYGPIETIAADSSGRLFIKFVYYLDCRDALKGHHNATSAFILVMAPSEQPRLIPGRGGSPMVRGFNPARSAVDQKSVYVGGLGEGATKKELEDLFSEFGKVIQINIIRKTFMDNGVNIFAFIEFSSPHEADRAAQAERYLHGYKLRIEAKEYSVRRRYAAQIGAPGSVRAPEPRFVELDRGFSLAPPPMQYNYEYGMHQMTPPSHHGYGAGAYNYGQMAYTTPPNQGYMLPMGMFSPTPPQTGAQYGYPAQYYMGAIDEADENGY
ncbi:hypothetical protein EDD36DRAFT_253026 [Exophiala viscosa]|uniref:RRM domain-containing protein n=1 Tax=Exophiala viscosa TaxID=2486360 RepID=A0AAN6DUG9_9EURO|nr:hypothetical protein EDD36DRAFT_253026 [Exophiala viscosa]